MGPTPPGVVLTSPGSPMLAGAVALAAGRFQPLVRLEPGMWSLDDPRDAGRVYRLGDVLTLSQAVKRFPRDGSEGRVGSTSRPDYDQLGDDCDFLTLAGDWPYRYHNDVEAAANAARGIHALDDLIGRNLEGDPEAEGLNASRRRWAYAGRLLGDPAASVARAMGALFLQPACVAPVGHLRCREPLVRVWHLGSGGRSASAVLRPGSEQGLPPRPGPRADLVSWHRVVDPMNRFGAPRLDQFLGQPAGCSRSPADRAGRRTCPGGFPAGRS